MSASKSEPTTQREGTPGFGAAAAIVAVCAAIPAFLSLLVWLIGLPFARFIGFKYRTAEWNQYTWYVYVRRQLLPGGWNIYHATGWFWLIATIVLLLATLWYRGPALITRKHAAITMAMVLATVLSFGMTWYALWDNLKPQANAYNSETQYVVEDITKMPAALRLLANGAHKGSGDCLQVGKHDVKSCISQGTMPMNWTPRKASAEAAFMKISKASTGASNTEVMDGSLTYLYSVNNGVWSAVRDGKGQQSLDAVVYWDGSNAATECRFADKYAIRGAFHGNRSNNLQNAIAAAYPELFYDIDDVWGFCNGDEPVVVVPMTKQYNVGNRTALTYGGDLIVRGDNGKLSMSLLNNPKTGTNFEAGELPGPSYPTSLTEKARYFSRWAAGQENMRRSSFGFEATDATEQFGNASEYLLQDASTKELSWVTPLTPRGSDSQQFVAYAITPAGEGHSGKLNTTKIYVLPDNDPNIVSLTDLSASARRALTLQDPGFFSGGGKIVEFLPVDATHWQAYGELGNRVDYRLEIPTNSQVQASVVSLNGDNGNKPAVGNASCGKKLSTLPVKQLTACLEQITKELGGRKLTESKS